MIALFASPVIGSDQAEALAEDLKQTAKLEDLHLWVDVKEKHTKAGIKTYEYWRASWRAGGRVQNVQLGSCPKLSRQEAEAKARKLKADALGLIRDI